MDMESTVSLISGNVKYQPNYYTFPIFLISVLFMSLLLILAFFQPISTQIEFEDSAQLATPEPLFKADYTALQWGYVCEDEMCHKVQTKDNLPTYKTCSMTCSKNSQLWPLPKKINKLGKQYANFFPYHIQLNVDTKGPATKLIKDAFEIFKYDIYYPPGVAPDNSTILVLHVQLDNYDIVKPTLSTHEGYHMTVSKENEQIDASIKADNFFGARHGLETLSQLIWYDENSKRFNILNEVDIEDYPEFPYRGVMIDTGRNFMSLDRLKGVIRGMAANKLNSMHWHITDSQSFPFDTPSVPEMALYGAYSKAEVYTASDIKKLVDYARVRGVRVIIEVDAPSHVNFGWNWGPDKGLGNLTLSCGSDNIEHLLNPFNENTLNVLEKIYKDVGDLQTTTEIFHLGGDEIFGDCWNKYQISDDFANYWANYTSLMFERLNSANSDRLPEYVVLWGIQPNTAQLGKYIPKEKIVIQFWSGNMETIVQQNYKVIYSPVGHYYLDCGFGKWREEKGPACGLFIQWHEYYRYQPWKEFKVNQGSALGSEVCLWSEQVGEDTVDTRLWPRAAAFAERMWSDLDTPDYIPKDVYLRLSAQRERFLGKGVRSETVWPERCIQNPELCP